MIKGPYRIDVLEVTIRFEEDVLGLAPINRRTLSDFIASRAPTDELADEEVNAIQDSGDPQDRRTGFPRDGNGIFAWDYWIRGMIKEIGNMHKDALGIRNIRSKIESYVVVEPRRVRFLDSFGTPITEPSGVLARPLRAMTPQGPRVSIAESEVVPAGSKLRFRTLVFENKGSKESAPLTPLTIMDILLIGEYHGFGQWRTGGQGRFKVEKSVVLEADAKWPGIRLMPGQLLVVEGVRIATEPKGDGVEERRVEMET